MYLSIPNTVVVNYKIIEIQIESKRFNIIKTCFNRY